MGGVGGGLIVATVLLFMGGHWVLGLVLAWFACSVCAAAIDG